MLKYVGKGVCSAIAIGKVSVFKRSEVSVKRVHVSDTEHEKERLAHAKKVSIEQLKEIYEKALKEVGETGAQIFDVHMMMIDDADYNESIDNIIETQLVNAEYAVAVTADNFAEMFSQVDDSYMQARAADIRDISNRIINNLSDAKSIDTGSDEKMIVCADDLAPSETVSLDKDKVQAFVTAYGSSNSHTAILARNMNIPAVIGVGEEFLEKIQDGMQMIVDGYTGEIYIEPDKETYENYQKKKQEENEKRELLFSLKGKDNVTVDGTSIEVYANIGSDDNIAAVLLNDAGGIGLFRSEFLYLESDDFPDEEKQFNVYRKVLENMAGKKVIIRTLDIGADKQADYFNLDKEENPALGFRAIRICLTHPEIFKTQLRALYRASVYGKLGIMFPMVISVEEVEKIKEMCEEVKRELKSSGVEYSDNIEVGIMIETPAAAVISDKLAPMVDFFSIGTNDLTQYVLACDRQNPKLDDFCDTHHEAILRLIKMSADNAHKNGAWVGICGRARSRYNTYRNISAYGDRRIVCIARLCAETEDTIRHINLG